MNELQVFNYQENEIRTIQRDGEPWFVLKDVCGVLDLGSPHKVAERLDEDEKGRNQIPTLGGLQETTIINESGLYNVILRSDKPEAKPFRKWITSEVLPSIRKTGSYSVPKLKVELAERRVKTMELNAKNRAAAQMVKLWTAAGVEPQYQALAMNQYYEGLELPRIALKASATALMDLTTIAKRLGIYSKTGKPHAQAVGAIIDKLTLEPSESALTPYSNNGHDGQSRQYTESVLSKVVGWLSENNYPGTIHKGQTTYNVKYRAGE